MKNYNEAFEQGNYEGGQDGIQPRLVLRNCGCNWNNCQCNHPEAGKGQIIQNCVAIGYDGAEDLVKELSPKILKVEEDFI